MANYVTGDGRSVSVDDIALLYRNLNNEAQPIKGTITPLCNNRYNIAVDYKAIDFDTLQAEQTSSVYTFSTSEQVIESVELVSDEYEFANFTTALSLNGRFRARLRGDAGKQYLQIWDNKRHIKTIRVSDLDCHGVINTDYLGKLVWSPFGEQDALLYVCQPKQAQHISYFQNLGQESGRRGEGFKRKEDWGERLDETVHTILAIIDVGDDCKMSVIDVADHSLAFPQWADDGNKIVSVAYKEKPRRVGLITVGYIPSKILVFDLTDQSTYSRDDESREFYMEIDESLSNLHPRVSHAGDKFVFISTNTCGVDRLMICHLNDKCVDELMDELFIVGLPENCFTSCDRYILIVTHEIVQHHIALVSVVKPNSMFEIKFPSKGIKLLDFRDEIILATGSSINETPSVFARSLKDEMIQMDGDFEEGATMWTKLDDGTRLEEVDYETFQIPAFDDEESFVSAILVTSKLIPESNQLPTVILPHGGPMSAYDLSYRMTNILNAKLGINTLLINYRGSTGVDKVYLTTLIGRVGECDVNDCLNTINQLGNMGKIDTNKLILQGGSYGGFLAAHLSCLGTFKFTSAIIRNPVIDFSSLFITCDGPQLCSSLVLSKESYDASSIPTSEDWSFMYQVSPISRAEDAYVPTLVLLGNKDRCVPKFQGELWVDKLRAKGVEVECRVYDDCHPLTKVDVFADLNVSTAIWMLDHLPFDD